MLQTTKFSNWRAEIQTCWTYLYGAKTGTCITYHLVFEISACYNLNKLNGIHQCRGWRWFVIAYYQNR